MILRQNAVADQRDRRAQGKLSIELDGKGVHRDRPDDVPWFAAHPDLGARHVAPEAVRVPHGDDPDPGFALGEEPSPVPRALARRQPPHLCEIAVPAQRGLQPVGGRDLAER